MLRSPRSLVLPRPFGPAFLEGSRFVSALKNPPQGILRLGRGGFEGVPITNPTIAAQLRRAIILVRGEGRGGQLALELKSSWHSRSNGRRVCLRSGINSRPKNSEGKFTNVRRERRSVSKYFYFNWPRLSH